MTVQEAFQKTVAELRELLGLEEARAVAGILFEDKYGINLTSLIREGSSDFKERIELENDLKRLLQSEPVQYLTGFRYFNGMKISLSPDVLIPRPETEELTRLIKAQEADFKGDWVDLCTGSGCIALSLRKFFPAASIIATDISGEALNQARKNELEIFGNESIRFQRHDLIQEDGFVTSNSIIVSNPPYIKWEESEEMNASVMNYEPHLALFAKGEDPLIFYKTILDNFTALKYYFELNPLTADELADYARNRGLKTLIHEDMFGKKRFAEFKF